MLVWLCSAGTKFEEINLWNNRYYLALNSDKIFLMSKKIDEENIKFICDIFSIKLSPALHSQLFS